MRKSNQRDLILDIINGSHNHYTSKEVYEEARKVLPNISLGTVYRNLNLLVEKGYIMRIKTKEGMDRFDNIMNQHDHFICDKCNKIIDVYEKISIDKDILPSCNVTYYTVQFHGICKDCFIKEEEKNGTKRK